MRKSNVFLIHMPVLKELVSSVCTYVRMCVVSSMGPVQHTGDQESRHIVGIFTGTKNTSFDV